MNKLRPLGYAYQDKLQQSVNYLFVLTLYPNKLSDKLRLRYAYRGSGMQVLLSCIPELIKRSLTAREGEV